MGLIGKLAREFGSAIIRSLSPDLQAWIRGMDIPDNEQGAKLTQPYEQSAWVYTAISVQAENLAQIPFRISRLGSGKARRVRALMGASDPKQRDFCRRALGETIIDSGDVVDLFERPHPTMGKTLFWEQVVSWDCLRGEVFILPLDENNQPVDLSERSPRVRRLLTLQPEMFWHNVIGYELMGWRYTGSPLMSPIPSEMLLPSEVVQIRAVNPYSYWRGMSPLSVALLPAMADYAAEMFMKGLLMNNADTGIIATTEQNLTAEQREQFTAALRERKRKAGTPDRPLFLSSGVKIEKPTISNVDMQFLETRRLLRQEIGAIFKVPETLMGFSDSKTSALSGGGNAINEDKLTFIQQNLGPKCRRYEAALAPIIQTFGDDLVGWFDIESLPAMQDSRRARLDSAGKAFAMGVPFNDINEAYDLGFRKYPWGDTGFLPFNLQAADQAGGAPTPSEDEPAPGDETGESGGDGDETPAEKGLRFLAKLAAARSESAPMQRQPDTTALWKRHMRARAGTVKLFKGKVGKVLNRFRAKALATLNTLAHPEKSGGHTCPECGKHCPEAYHCEPCGARWLGSQDAKQRNLVDLIFSATQFGHELKLVLEQPMRGALQQAGEEARQEVGAEDPWTMPPQKALEFIRSREQAIMGVGGTVRDQLNTSLVEGYENGDTMAQLSDRVKAVFNNLDDSEAERVARTETNIAFNAARHEALDDAGIQYKSWLSSHGPNVRPGHAAAEDAYIDDPIPLDEPFIVDIDGDPEQLMYPGDTSLGASLANIINCQCIQLAAEKQEEDEKGAWFKVFGLGRVYFTAKNAESAKKLKHCCNLL